MFKDYNKQSQTHRQKKQWTHDRVDKARDKTFNKVYADYKQCELNEKG